MILYYTSSTADDTKSAPTDSIGGFVSCTELPGAGHNTLFSDIGLPLIRLSGIDRAPNTIYRCVALKNTTLQTVHAVLLYTQSGGRSQYRIGAQAVAAGNRVKRLVNQQQAPQGVVFYNTESTLSEYQVTLSGMMDTPAIVVDGQEMVLPVYIQSLLDLAYIIADILRPTHDVQVLEETFSLKIKNKKVDQPQPPQLSAVQPSSLVFVYTPIVRGVDQSILVAEELLPGAMLAIWLEMNYLPMQQLTSDELLELWFQGEEPDPLPSETFTLGVQYV